MKKGQAPVVAVTRSLKRRLGSNVMLWPQESTPSGEAYRAQWFDSKSERFREARVEIWRDIGDRSPARHLSRKPPTDQQETFSLRRVRLNSGGYDENGRYFGQGEPLWEYDNREDWGHLRAATRDAAKRALLTKIPSAKFRR